MAKIHPNPLAIMNTSTSPNSPSSGRETFTVWMKSLVFHGNGCTVFNSKGEVAFRVDNYQQRCSREVFLMDSIGRVLFSLHRKKGINECWDGFKWIERETRIERPWFRVRRNRSIFSKDASCQVTLRRDGNNASCYRIVGSKGKTTIRITDSSGQILAEAMRKQSSEGVRLGDDVMRLVVEPNVDQSLIMALVTVYYS